MSRGDRRGVQSERAVFLLDVDNTLLDNDALKDSYDREIRALVGPAEASRFWATYESVRQLTGVIDYGETLARFHREVPQAPIGRIRKLIFEAPFRQFVYADVRPVLRQMWQRGSVVILSDGDATYQPRKIDRSGLREAARGNVLVYPHKEDHLAEVLARFPAAHYVQVDDKASLLARTKAALGDRVTTVHVRQGHYAGDPANPSPDITVERIGDLRGLSLGAPRLARTPLARKPAGGASMPQQSWSDKRERQYEHVKASEKDRGRSEKTAKRIAAATVNQTRTAKGETKEPKSASERAQAQNDMSRAGRKGGRR